MNPGKLNKRITIQYIPDDAEQNSYGEEVEDGYVDFATLWADVNIGSGREFFAAQKINAELSGIIKIRYRPGIKHSMRVIYDGRKFSLTKPPINVGEKNIEIELHVKELI